MFEERKKKVDAKYKNAEEKRVVDIKLIIIFHN